MERVSLDLFILTILPIQIRKWICSQDTGNSRTVMISFKSLHLINPIIRAVTEAGYSKPTEIQYSVIPHILAGKDIIGYGQTGTGKTAAFAMPILQLLKKYNPDHNEIRTLILTPTRELAIQIEENLGIYSKYLPLSQLSVYGGVSTGSQLAALRKRVDILVATPGRLLDLAGQRHIDLSKIEVLVLDEADRMLDMGFINDVNKILRMIPQKRQTLFFSATMPVDIRKFAKTMLQNPVEVTVYPVSTKSVQPDAVNEPEACIHRNGRTERAGAEGTAIALCNAEEQVDLKNIQKLIGFTMPVRQFQK
jgi:ATP-dependent RNA helicase RhlE